MEAEVGIGRLMPYFQYQNTRFSSVNQVTLALLEQTISNPSTETFTEGLDEDRKRISRDDALCAHFIFRQVVQLRSGLAKDSVRLI